MPENEYIPMAFPIIFDENSSAWNTNPEFNRVFLRIQMNYFNELLYIKEFITVNEVFDALGIPRTADGMIYGWMKGDDLAFGFDYAEDWSITIVLMATNIYEQLKARS